MEYCVAWIEMLLVSISLQSSSLSVFTKTSNPNLYRVLVFILSILYSLSTLSCNLLPLHGGVSVYYTHALLIVICICGILGPMRPVSLSITNATISLCTGDGPQVNIHFGIFLSIFHVMFFDEIPIK